MAGNMFGIGSFFSKIQNSFTKEVLVRTVIKDSIKKHTGADIPVTSISFKSSVVVLGDVSQAVRSAVFIKKQAILKDVAANQDIREIKDIR